MALNMIKAAVVFKRKKFKAQVSVLGIDQRKGGLINHN